MAMRALVALAAAASAEALALAWPQVGAHDAIEALQHPPAVFKSMSSTVSQLQRQLEQAHQQSLADVAAKKAAYEKSLREGLLRNRDMERLNTDLRQDIAAQQEENRQLRATSLSIEEESRALRADLMEMQTNITLAKEFGEIALNTSNALLLQASEMTIFEELDEEDAKKTADRSRDDRLDAIGSKRLAMLQLATRVTQPVNTQAVLQAMISSWEQITVEQNASLALMQQKFEEDIRPVSERYEALRMQQEELGATKAAEALLHTKLAGAVTHLSSARDLLRRQRRALRQLARLLSKTAIPVPPSPPQTSTLPQAQPQDNVAREQVPSAPVAPLKGSSLFSWAKR